MEAIKQCFFPQVLFKSCFAVQGGSNFCVFAKILECEYSIKRQWAALCCGAVYYAVQGGSKFWDRGWYPKVQPFK